MTLQDLQKLSNGTNIPQLRGVIHDVQPPGPVQMPEGRTVKAQRATLKLDDSSTVRLDIYGEQHLLPRDSKGKRYAFVSSNGQGVVKHSYTPQGSTEPVTVVRISTGCVASQVIEPKPRQPMKENPIAPIARLWVACAKQAKLAALEADILLQPSEVQALATTFFIEANKKQIQPPSQSLGTAESQPREPAPQKPAPEAVARNVEDEFNREYDKLMDELGSANVNAAYDVFLDRYKSKCKEAGADVNYYDFYTAMLDKRWDDLVARAKEFAKVNQAKVDDEIPMSF